MSDYFHNSELDTQNSTLSERRLRLSEKGWTLIEVMLVAALIALITPAMTYLFTKVQQGMAADEMRTQLQQANQEELNRIQTHVGANRHFFFSDASGVSFLGYLNLSSAPATVAGMTLCMPQTSTSGSLSPNVAGFQSANVGNALLFGAYDCPQTIYYQTGAPKIWTAVPMTVSGNPVTDQHGTKQTLIIDIYRFYLYYLTSKTAKQLFDATDYNVIEWESQPFVDYNEIENFNTDSVLEGNMLANIVASGITVAWDPTQTDPSQAFVTFGSAAYGTTSTGVTNIDGTFKVSMETYNNVTRIESGILTTGFRFGISPNTNNWNSCPVQIPLFAAVTTAGVAFPNGFEIAATSNPIGRQIMVRSVLVGEGASGGGVRAIYNDINMVDEISDNW